MAIKLRDQWKVVAGNTQLNLTPRSGESIQVTDILINTPVTNYATIVIGVSTLGYWRVGNTQGNLLFCSTNSLHRPNLYKYLISKGLFRPYNICEGETFSITGVAQSTSWQAVKYDVYDAADLNTGLPNSSNFKELDYICMGKYSTTLVTGKNLLNTSSMPSSFPSFPFNSVVPNNREIKISGIIFSDFARTSGSASNKQNTVGIHLTSQQEYLNSLDLNGIPVLAIAGASDGTVIASGKGIVGGYSDQDMREPYLLSQPLIFGAGQDLLVEVETNLSAGTANITAADAELCLIATQMVK